MPFLRQSTVQTIRFGPFLDAGDGVTEETALTITQALRRLSKDGGAFAQSSHIGNSVHDSDGWYSDDLDATDTATVGELILNVQDPANHLPVWMRWWVLTQAVYDAIYGAAAAGPLQSTVAGRTLDVNAAGEAGLDLANVSGVLGFANVGWVDLNSRVDVGQFLGNAVVISSGLPDMNVATFDNIAAPAAWVASFNDPSAAAISAAVWSETVRILTAATNITSTGGTTFTQTGDSFARIGVTGSGLTTLAQASIATEARLAELDPANIPTDLSDIQGATFNGTTDSLEAIRNRGDAAWTTGAAGPVPNLLVSTTIATLASQTSFTLAAGSADNDAYDRAQVIVTDSATALQKAVGEVLNWVGGTLTMTLVSDPAIFTMAIGDLVSVIAVPQQLDDKTGFSLGVGGIPVGAFVTDSITADAAALDFGQEMADRILARNIAGGSDTGRIVTDALRALRNRREITLGTLTVYEEDDTTPAWTGVVTTAAGNPIVEIDPA